MCSPASQEVIREVVSDLVSANSMFTAFEVSLEVQRRQTEHNKPIERDRNMKHRIHTELEGHVLSGRYSRMLRDVGADIPANIYYPVGADPSQYVPLNRSGNSRQKQANTPHSPANPQPQPDQAGSAPDRQGDAGQATPPVPIDPKPDDHTGRKADARGTLTVPSQLMRNLGFLPGDTAYVYKVGVFVLVAKTVPSGLTPLATYTVDEYLNVRITAPTLLAGDLNVGLAATYNFGHPGGNTISVTN